MFKLSTVLLVLAATLRSLTLVTGHAVQMPVSASEAHQPVPGVNNATYCTIPSSEQLAFINFFDIAPLPLPVEQMFFTYLRGYIPHTVTGLDDAIFSITMDADLASGNKIVNKKFIVPLATFAADNVAHLTIRYQRHPEGSFGGPLKTGVMEILTDYWFPGMFLKAGNYTFKVEGILPGVAEREREEEKKDRYLFAFQMSQWLEP